MAVSFPTGWKSFLWLLPVLAAYSATAFTVQVTEHNVGANFAVTRPWTLRASGQCGARCQTVRRTHSVACENRLFVAWSAHEEWTPNQQYPNQNLFDEVSVGYVTEYTIDADTGASTLVSNTEISYCNEMGGIDVASDCSVVGVLCRSSSEAADIGASDWVADTEAEFGTQFGWSQTSIGDMTNSKYRIVDQMFLLEWTQGTAGQTALEPTSKVMVSHSIGGWSYGSFSLALNADQSIYSIDLKTTITSDPDPVWHEGSTHFAIDRGTWDWNRDLSAGWACGVGHVQLNRLTYNHALDKWARYCYTDGCYDEERSWTGECYGTFFGTLPKDDSEPPTQLKMMPAGDSTWNWNGGPMNLISRGSKGFLAVTVAPDEEYDGKKLTLGLATLPTDQAKCNSGEVDCSFKWIDSAYLGGTNVYPRPDGDAQKGFVGFANLAHVGSDGEEGDRFMIGWADDIQFQGRPSQYYMVEIDAEGDTYGGVHTLNGTGWGEEDVWVAMESGCIAWPFTWSGDAPGGSYGSMNTEVGMSEVMRITVVCPGDQVEKDDQVEKEDDNDSSSGRSAYLWWHIASVWCSWALANFFIRH